MMWGEDRCWKAAHRWFLVTQRSPREVRLPVAAVYYRPGACCMFQYRVARRPDGVRCLSET